MNEHDILAVRVEDLSKRFLLYKSVTDRFLDYASRTRARGQEFWALQNVNFEIRRGECFGIVGANGSGKSTLLKLLTGTLLPTEGRVLTRGRVLALLELGAGMNPELTGRENVLASASLLGFPPQYASERIADIQSFADIGDFFDRPVKIYSSGMFVRVAFSIYLFMKPDIFIVDEALSVGDIFFQQKCFAALQRIISEGTTVIFVSHDMSVVQTMCTRAMLLKKGEMVHLGRPDEVVNRYYDDLGRKTAEVRAGQEANAAPARRDLANVASEIRELLDANGLERPSISADSSLEIVAARVLDPAKSRTVASIRTGDTVRFEAVLRATRSVQDPSVSLSLYDRFGRCVFGTSTRLARRAIRTLTDTETVLVHFQVTMQLAPGQYTYQMGFGSVSPATKAPQERDQLPMLGPLIVYWDEQTSPFYGIGGLPAAIVPTRSEVTP